MNSLKSDIVSKKLNFLSVELPWRYLFVFLDTQQAKLLEERYKTTLEKSPPEFVKPLPAIQEIQPGETTRFVFLLLLSVAKDQ